MSNFRQIFGVSTLVLLKSAHAVDDWDITLGKSLCSNPLTEDQAWNAGLAFGRALGEEEDNLALPPFVIELEPSSNCGEGNFGYDVQIAVKLINDDHFDNVMAQIEQPQFNGWFAFGLKTDTELDVTVWDMDQVTCASLEEVGDGLCPESLGLVFNTKTTKKKKNVQCTGEECRLACCKTYDPCPIKKKEKHCSKVKDVNGEEMCWWDALSMECIRFPDKCWKIDDHSQCAVATDCEWKDDLQSCGRFGNGVPCKAIEDPDICTNISDGWCTWSENRCANSDERDNVNCKGWKTLEDCDAVEDGVCMWSVSDRSCVKARPDGFSCKDVTSRPGCNQKTYGNCIWVVSTASCGPITRTFKCNEKDRRNTCENEEGCQWNEIHEACTRGTGDGVPCGALETEDDCLRLSGGYCDWVQESRECADVVSAWSEVCDEFESRASCNKERQSRCIWDTTDSKCDAVQVQGIRCKDIDTSKICDKYDSRCSWSADKGCVPSGDAATQECGEFTGRASCANAGGCLWDQKNSLCFESRSFDKCAGEPDIETCQRSDDCVWDSTYQVCYTEPATCADSNYWTCLYTEDCTWTGTQENGICTSTAPEPVDCSEATSDDACTERGCSWDPSGTKGGRRGRRRKKTSGTCKDPEQTAVNTCAGYEHHQTLAAQTEHCATVPTEKAKHCRERGCERVDGNCTPKLNPACADVNSASCCRLPGCFVNYSNECTGEFTGWLDE